MTPPMLPARGIFIPTDLIYEIHLPPCLLLTWIRLRGLVWNGAATLTMSQQEIARWCGVSQPTLRRHLSRLQGAGALSWQAGGTGVLVVSFDDRVSAGSCKPPPAHGRTLHHHNPKEYAAYFPTRIMGYISYQDEGDESAQRWD